MAAYLSMPQPCILPLVQEECAYSTDAERTCRIGCLEQEVNAYSAGQVSALLCFSCPNPLPRLMHRLTVGDLSVRLVWKLVPDSVACLSQLLIELEINRGQRLIELFGLAGTDDS